MVFLGVEIKSLSCRCSSRGVVLEKLSMSPDDGSIAESVVREEVVSGAGTPVIFSCVVE